MKYIFLGPPGAGKGTCASEIAHKLVIPHISTGAMFRQIADEGDELGLEAKEKHWGNGDLVPDKIATDLLFKRISKADCKNGYILDGFLRTIAQADALYDSGIDIYRVPNLVVPDEVLIERLSNRRTCRDCNSIYNLLSAQPKREGTCDKCHGQDLYQRNDDKSEAITKRLKVYYVQTAPLVRYYADKGLLRDVDGDQKVEDVISGILEEIK